MDASQRAAESVGSLIRLARRKRGWTAEEASKKANVAQKTWARAERGDEVRAASLRSIAEVFDLPSDTLLVARTSRTLIPDLAARLGVEAPLLYMTNDGQEAGEAPYITRAHYDGTGPDRTVAAARVHVENGVEISEGVSWLVEAAPLALTIEGMIRKLVTMDRDENHEQLLQALMRCNQAQRVIRPDDGAS